MICVPLGRQRSTGDTRCFSAEISAVRVAPSSQLLLVRREDPQPIVRGLCGYAAGAFLAGDVLFGSVFTSVHVVELTCHCCCHWVVAGCRLAVVFLVGRAGFYP